MNALSDARLPDLELPRLEFPRIHLPEAIAKLEWPATDMSSIDVAKGLSGLVGAARIGRDARRPRWPLALGALIVAGLAGWAILSNDKLRDRLASLVSAIGERVSAMRSNRYDPAEIDRGDPIAFPAAETKPIEADLYTDSTSDDSPDYPAGLGSNTSDGIPAFEETGSRA